MFKDFNFYIHEQDADKTSKSLNINDLKEIIRKTGGKIRELSQKGVYQIVLTPEEQETKISNIKKENIYSHKWILDSISNANVLDTEEYILN